MGAHQTRTNKAKAAEPALLTDCETDSGQRVCPTCGESFVPRTEAQSFCKMKCLVDNRKRRGVYDEVVKSLVH